MYEGTDVCNIRDARILLMCEDISREG